MPNATVRASATALPKSRRSALGLFVAAPAAMLAFAKGSPIAASDLASLDPIFAVIEAHKETYRIFGDCSHQTDEVAAEEEGRSVTEADELACNEASAYERGALALVVDTIPTTIAGIRAAIEHIGGLEDHEFMADFAKTLLMSPVLAAGAASKREAANV